MTTITSPIAGLEQAATLLAVELMKVEGMSEAERIAVANKVCSEFKQLRREHGMSEPGIDASAYKFGAMFLLNLEELQKRPRRHGQLIACRRAAA
jgi:hypothetical protein